MSAFYIYATIRYIRGGVGSFSKKRVSSRFNSFLKTRVGPGSDVMVFGKESLELSSQERELLLSWGLPVVLSKA